jgi:hypothetical protein
MSPEPYDSNSHVAFREEVGGRGRDRTGDPLLAKQMLSQLSYTPTVGATAILNHLSRCRNSNSPIAAIPVSELCRGPRRRADSGCGCPPVRRNKAFKD